MENNNGENEKKEQESTVDNGSEKLQRQENESEQGNQYDDDRGEDENGPKPSADEQG